MSPYGDSGPKDRTGAASRPAAAGQRTTCKAAGEEQQVEVESSDQQLIDEKRTSLSERFAAAETQFRTFSAA